MFPGIYEFRWDAGHIVFLGIFYSVLVVVASTLVIAAMRSARNFRSPRAEAIRWHVDFEDLPASARRCRHELTGETASRECPNAFDCRHCAEHPKFVAARSVAPVVRSSDEVFAGGFRLAPDAMYHRGHTWVRWESDGTATVGLDDLASRLIGVPDAVELPELGARLVVSGSGWSFRKNGLAVRILSPLDGEVIEIGDASKGWYLKIRPDAVVPDTKHLLSPREAQSWMLREVERLHFALSSEGVGLALADGGMPVEDLSKVMPPEQLDEAYGMVFLEP